MLVDSGPSAGEGRLSGVTKSKRSVICEGDSDQNVDVFEFANRSGSAVLPRPVGSIKMIIGLYPCSSIEFIRHHGNDGARRYLEVCWFTNAEDNWLLILQNALQLACILRA